MYQSCNTVLQCSFCCCKHNPRKLWGSGTWLEIGHLYLHCCNFPAARSGMTLAHWQIPYVPLVSHPADGVARVFWLWQPKRGSVGTGRQVKNRQDHIFYVFPQAALGVFLVKYMTVFSAWENEIIYCLKLLPLGMLQLLACSQKLVPTESGISNLYSFIVL